MNKSIMRLSIFVSMFIVITVFSACNKVRNYDCSCTNEEVKVLKTYWLGEYYYDTISYSVIKRDTVISTEGNPLRLRLKRKCENALDYDEEKDSTIDNGTGWWTDTIITSWDIRLNVKKIK